MDFGVFASPERTLLFDLNDFDETLPGPFEYDVKRMAASFTIAGRNNGFATADIDAATCASVTAYREAMAEFAEMRNLEIWYARLSEQEIMAAVQAASEGVAKKKEAKQISKAQRLAAKNARKAHTRDSLQALESLAKSSTVATASSASRRSSSQRVISSRCTGCPPTNSWTRSTVSFARIELTLQFDRRHLLERFELVDMARKVVGVGSVGTRAFIGLLQGRDDGDPLFLQVKEATASVLEDYLPKSQFKNPGERVVQGQRMMQAASDIFLGWTKGHEANRYLYWRQLRDMKGSALVETMAPGTLKLYAGFCGWTLARAHARSGDAIALAQYLGKNDDFDQSITYFSKLYAEQNDLDYAAFCEAVASGHLEAVEGL